MSQHHVSDPIVVFSVTQEGDAAPAGFLDEYWKQCQQNLMDLRAAFAVCLVNPFRRSLRVIGYVDRRDAPDLLFDLAPPGWAIHATWTNHKILDDAFVKVLSSALMQTQSDPEAAAKIILADDRLSITLRRNKAPGASELGERDGS